MVKMQVEMRGWVRWGVLTVTGIAVLVAFVLVEFGTTRSHAAGVRGHALYDRQFSYFERGDPDKRRIALTFDDGPHPASLNRILDILRTENIHATFFLVGLRVRQHPEMVRDIVNYGNEVGNHTEDHVRLTKLDAQQLRQEVLDCEAAIETASGIKTKLLRPPGMRFEHEELNTIRDLGYITVGCTAIGRDCSEVPPEHILSSVLSKVQPGGIVLLHDSPWTADALPQLIKELKDKGYEFATVSELLADTPAEADGITQIHGRYDNW